MVAGFLYNRQGTRVKDVVPSPTSRSNTCRPEDRRETRWNLVQTGVVLLSAPEYQVGPLDAFLEAWIPSSITACVAALPEKIGN